MPQLANDCAPALIALTFAQALGRGDFRGAHAMLNPVAHASLSEQYLASRYTEMISYGDGPADLCEVVLAVDAMPQMSAEEAAWVYVAIAGPGFSEAVRMFVRDDPEVPAVRIVGWGRP